MPSLAVVKPGLGRARPARASAARLHRAGGCPVFKGVIESVVIPASDESDGLWGGHHGMRFQSFVGSAEDECASDVDG
jgi:hypothetical protein